MKKEWIVTPILISLTLTAFLTSAQDAAGANGLRCEYLSNPLGIDAERPRLSWLVPPGPRLRRQTAYRVLVASSPANLRRDRGDLWDSGRVTSDRNTFIVYDGKPLPSRTKVWWKVRVWTDGRAMPWSEPAYWSMGLLDDTDWKGRWIGLPRPTGVPEKTPLPFPWLRKSATLSHKPQRATAYVNALGYYELYINGRKVDDHVLSPGVSDYSRRNLYRTHDVTDYLVAGNNSIGLWLGRGWYVRGHPGVVYDGPLVRMQIDAVMPDGKSLQIATDATWKARASPITPLGRGTAFGDYGGERYDARLEVVDWNAVSLDDSKWESAAVFDPPTAITTADVVEPNRILESIRPVRIDPTPANGWLIDMGKNYTGWLELRLPPDTPAGKTIKIEFADFPPPPSGGRYHTFNQRAEYITRAGAGQAIRSRFNYHAFRYAHVTGLDHAPQASDLHGHFIRTSYARASEFESSNDLLNRIYRMVTWTYECLTLGGYVVDCPHRERLGYGGDAGTSIETGLSNFDTGGLYTRWAANWRDAQDPQSGDLPYTAPSYPDQGGGGPMWSGFVVTLPWHVYLQYGDREVLEKNYPMIQKWLAFADSRTKDQLLEPYVSIGIRAPQWNYLGDWVTPRRGPGTDLGRHPISARFMNNGHYLYTLQLASKIATILGKSTDAKMYAERASALGRALHDRFFDASQSSYATGEQPYLALALLFEITPPELRPAVRQKLEATIRGKNTGHFDSGMHGTYFVLKQLLEDDRNDLLFEMTTKRDFPSWGNMLEQGATTAWESWTGGSHIHDTLISIGQWFIQGIGGIRVDEQSPGFRHFFLKPAPVGDLTFARTRYRSIHGTIVSNWRIERGNFYAEVSVPPGTTATLYLPSAVPEQVTEGGRAVRRSVGITVKEQQVGRAVFELAPGSYQFVSKLSP